MIKRREMNEWLDANPEKSGRDWLLEVRCSDDAQREELKALFERVDASKHSQLDICPLEDWYPVHLVENGPAHVIFIGETMSKDDTVEVGYDFRVGGFYYDLDAHKALYDKDPDWPAAPVYRFFEWKAEQLGVEPKSFAKYAYKHNFSMRYGYRHWSQLLK